MTERDTSMLGRPSPIQADPLLVETISRLLDDHCPPSSVRAAEASRSADPEVWRHLLETGLSDIGRADGQDPGGVVDAVAVLRACGAHAAPVPIGEHGLLAGWLLARAGVEPPGRCLTVPVPDPGDSFRMVGDRVSARFARVPFASSASHLVAGAVLDGREQLIVASRDRLLIDTSLNLAGEPRDIVEAEAQAIASLPGGTLAALQRRAALSRAALSAGAMQRAVQLAAIYSRERRQFGRPIGAFQAVQHLLALAAEHVANATTAVWVAAEALAADELDPFCRVDAARSVTHEAMEVVVRSCHQVFGAIGLTREHELHLHTRRLLAWDLEWAIPGEAAAAFARWLLATPPAQRWGALTGVTLPHPTTPPTSKHEERQ